MRHRWHAVRPTRVRPVDEIGEVDGGRVIVEINAGLEINPRQRLRGQHLGADVRFVLADALPPLPEHGVRVYAHPAVIGQPIGAFNLDLVVATQIDHVGQPQPEECLDIALSQVLQIV